MYEKIANTFYFQFASFTTLSSNKQRQEQMKIDLMKIDGNKTSTYPKSKPVLYLSPKEKMKMVVLGM